MKSSADWEQFGPRKLETSSILLDEIQSLGTPTAGIIEAENSFFLYFNLMFS